MLDVHLCVCVCYMDLILSFVGEMVARSLKEYIAGSVLLQ